MDFDFSGLVSADGVYALRTALLLVAFFAFAWSLRRSRRDAEHSSAHLGARLETALGEIRRLSGQVIALGGAIETISVKVSQPPPLPAVAPVTAPSSGPSSGNARGYETAIRLARGGASVDEIVASCGTTRAEAKLLRRLHEGGDGRKTHADGTRFDTARSA